MMSQRLHEELNRLGRLLGIAHLESIYAQPCGAVTAVREIAANVALLEDGLRAELAAECKRREDAERCRRCKGKGWRSAATLSATQPPIHYNMECGQCHGTGRDRGPRDTP